MYNTFSKDTIHIDDVVVYLKNERTGSSTVRKCKFVGQVIGFTKTKVEIHRFSPPDTFITPEEIKDLGVDTVHPNDVVHIIISKYEEDMHTKTLMQLNDIAMKYKRERDAAINDVINGINIASNESLVPYSEIVKAMEDSEDVISDAIRKLNKEQFIQQYCHNCGTQRCEGIDTEWFDGCAYKDYLQ